MEYLPSLNSGASLRNSFEDIEVNEGRWLMEGTANYLKNVNLVDQRQDRIKTYEVSISNLIDNGTLKMSGDNITSIYNNLLSDIYNEEITNNTKALMADVDLISIDASKSTLAVKVVYGKGNTPVYTPSASMAWIDASYSLSENCNEYLRDRHDQAVNSGCTFSPEVIVYFVGNDYTGPDCTVDGSICLSSIINANPAIDNYDLDWLGDINSGDTKNVLEICQGIVDEINNSYSNNSYLGHPYIMTFVLTGAIEEAIGVQPNQEYFNYHIINGVVGFSQKYCY